MAIFAYGTMGRIGSTSYVLPIRLSYRTLNRVVRVVIAGIIAIYGVVVAVLISGQLKVS